VTQFAHSGYPDGLGDENDISLRQLRNKLVRRTVTAVSFELGHLELTLDNETTVRVRGNSVDDDSVTIVVDAHDR